jgi:hypothetical protein
MKLNLIENLGMRKAFLMCYIDGNGIQYCADTKISAKAAVSQ